MCGSQATIKKKLCYIICTGQVRSVCLSCPDNSVTALSNCRSCANFATGIVVLAAKQSTIHPKRLVGSFLWHTVPFVTTGKSSRCIVVV